MKFGIILTIITIIIVVGPIVSAVIMYKDNLIALIVPDVEELTDKISNYFPTVEYADYEVIDAKSSFNVKFNVTNNSGEDFTVKAVNCSAYCSEHEGVLLGYGYGERLPLIVPKRSSKILSLLVTFTNEGKNHVEADHRGDKDFYAVLKNVLVVVQGIEVKLGDNIEVGPIKMP